MKRSVLEGIFLMLAHEFPRPIGGLRGLEKQEMSRARGYRARWKKGCLVLSLEKARLLREVEAGWEQSQWSCKAVVLNQR